MSYHNNPRHNPRNRPTLRNEDLDPALTEVSRTVIGCAIEIHKEIGPGFDKSVYENALALELRENGVKFSQNHVFDIRYKGKSVGQHSVSLYVDDRFVVQVLTDDREVDGFDRNILRAQLRAADLGLGLIINFHRRRLKDGGLVRVLNPDKLDSIRAEGSHHDDEDEYDDDDDDDYEDDDEGDEGDD